MAPRPDTWKLLSLPSRVEASAEVVRGQLVIQDPARGTVRLDTVRLARHLHPDGTSTPTEIVSDRQDLGFPCYAAPKGADIAKMFAAITDAMNA